MSFSQLLPTDPPDASPLQQFDVAALEVLADASAPAADDASPAAAAGVADARLCAWCKAELSSGSRGDALFCGRKCRQAAFRIRRRRLVESANCLPMRMGYADPPYPGLARLYKNEPSYAGEVDHAQLVASLEALYDGFALSTSARALATVLPLFTRPIRVCAWVKPIGVSAKTWGVHNAWEPLIVAPGRQLRPGKRDYLSAKPARGGDSTLIGRKPEAFCVWLFGLLGLLPGDQLDDLYPGSGIVGRAWAELNRKSHP